MMHKSTIIFTLLVACLPILLRWLSYRSLIDDEAYAFSRHINIINQPNVTHSRFRLIDYTQGVNKERFFFQWWNYLIDSPSIDQPFQIITQINHFSNKVEHSTNLSSSVTNNEWFVVGLKHGSIRASLQVPLNEVSMTQSMNLAYQSTNTLVGSSKYRQVYIIQRAIDDDTYRVEGLIPVQQSINQPVKYVAFNSTYHRVHGVYTGLDREKDNINQCTVISNHFAYDSVVSGTWSELDETLNVLHEYSFSSSDHRGYAAGSWGCQLPSGEPAVKYPWTWAWLSIPPSESSSDKASINNHPAIGVCVGSAHFDGTWILGEIVGTYAIIGIGGQSFIVSSTATLHTGSVLEMPVQSATNDRYLTHLNVSLSSWQTFHDDLGTAELPMTQVYDVLTSNYSLTLTLTTQSTDQFFRAPVIVESLKTNKLAMFSDFRAVNVQTHLRLLHRQNQSVIYDGPVVMNAVEYAYQADLNTDIGSAMNTML